MGSQTLSVPSISCDHCKMSIEGAVGALPGVGRVSVDVPGRAVVLDYDESAVSLATIIDAISDAGYEVAR